jgi:hypothetical protein
MNYEKNANEVAEKHGLKLEILKTNWDYHFHSDKENNQKRNIYTCKLSKGDTSYTFKFGASLANPQAPSMYDVLSCLQKYDVGSLEDFCSEFGYNFETISEYKRIRKLYDGVCEEYKEFAGLFDGEIPEDVLEIN